MLTKLDKHTIAEMTQKITGNDPIRFLLTPVTVCLSCIISETDIHDTPNGHTKDHQAASWQAATAHCKF